MSVVNTENRKYLYLEITIEARYRSFLYYLPGHGSHGD